VNQQYVNLFCEELLQATKSAIDGSEEDLRIRCERIFLNFLPQWGIEYDTARYEFHMGKAGFTDSLFGHVVIEYKKYGLLKSAATFLKAEKQLNNYLEAEAKRIGNSVESYVGVLFDGQHIAFVRWAGNEWRPTKKLIFTEDTAKMLLQYIHSLSSYPLDPAVLTRLLGPNSKVAADCLSSLWDAFKIRRQRTEMLFKEWSRLFGQVTGFEHGQNKDLVEFARNHGVDNICDLDKFIFVMHTYYALLIKLLAAELLTYFRHGLGSSYVEHLLTLNQDTLKDELEHLENGGVYKDNLINNFLEGDFFCWYLGEWSDPLGDAMKNLAGEIAKFEPATSILDPTRIEDLLKKLYQNLVPPSVRHDLGEFYTPDWLAEHVLNKVGFSGKDKRRILDPTCGSGTFLVMALKMLISEVRQKEDGAVVLDRILDQVVGFDLNPLAVIAARTNYLLALGDLINQTDKPIEIPIYLTDSIFAPHPVQEGTEVNYVYKINTIHKDIDVSIPTEIIETGKLGILLAAVEYAVMTYTKDKEKATLYLKNSLKQEGLPEKYLSQLVIIYEQIAYLHTKEWNRIWCRIIKNHYASAFVGKFDLIVGNPPWLRWTRLPEGYRETVKEYCKQYGLFSKDVWVGGIETDISTVVLYSACERWLADKGTLAFLITRTVFKSESSEGFRNFRLLGEDKPLGVYEVEDMTDIKPFEGVTNKTSLILLKKGRKTTYPLKYVVWSKKKPGKISDKASLQEVMAKVKQEPIVAYPLYENGGPWLTVPAEELDTCKAMIGSSPYRGRKGVCADSNGIYWLDNMQPQGKKSIRFTNNPGLGRNSQIPKVSDTIEKELVYPLARGRDIKPFCFDYSGMCIILPQKGMDGFPEEYMMQNYPHTLEYLMRFETNKGLLSKRSSYRRFSVRRNAPVYSMWNVGDYTFAPYKVAWSEISSGLVSAVLSDIDHPVLGKKLVIPDHKIYFAYMEDENEAYYLCACLNSDPVRAFVKGYTEGTQIAAHVLEYVRIPKFDAGNKNHLALAQISKDLHNEACTDDKILKKATKRINDLVTMIMEQET